VDVAPARGPPEPLQFATCTPDAGDTTVLPPPRSTILGRLWRFAPWPPSRLRKGRAACGRRPLTPPPFSWIDHLYPPRCRSDGGIVRPRALGGRHVDDHARSGWALPPGRGGRAWPPAEDPCRHRWPARRKLLAEARPSTTFRPPASAYSPSSSTCPASPVLAGQLHDALAALCEQERGRPTPAGASIPLIGGPIAAKADSRSFRPTDPRRPWTRTSRGLPCRLVFAEPHRGGGTAKAPRPGTFLGSILLEELELLSPRILAGKLLGQPRDRLPPGRAKTGDKAPPPTGSAALTMTIAMVVVARWGRQAPPAWEGGDDHFHGLAHEGRPAIPAKRSGRPSAQRYSNTTFPAPPCDRAGAGHRRRATDDVRGPPVGVVVISSPTRRAVAGARAISGPRPQGPAAAAPPINRSTVSSLDDLIRPVQERTLRGSWRPRALGGLEVDDPVRSSVGCSYG